MRRLAASASLAALLLLWVFHGVVRQAMAQGESRRAQAAEQEFAAWHCAREGGRAARDACTALIGAQPPQHTAVAP